MPAQSNELSTSDKLKVYNYYQSYSPNAPTETNRDAIAFLRNDPAFGIKDLLQTITVAEHTSEDLQQLETLLTALTPDLRQANVFTQTETEAIRELFANSPNATDLTANLSEIPYINDEGESFWADEIISGRQTITDIEFALSIAEDPLVSAELREAIENQLSDTVASDPETALELLRDPDTSDEFKTEIEAGLIDMVNDHEAPTDDLQVLLLSPDTPQPIETAIVNRLRIDSELAIALLDDTEKPISSQQAAFIQEHHRNNPNVMEAVDTYYERIIESNNARSFSLPVFNESLDVQTFQPPNALEGPLPLNTDGKPFNHYYVDELGDLYAHNNNSRPFDRDNGVWTYLGDAPAGLQPLTQLHVNRDNHQLYLSDNGQWKRSSSESAQLARELSELGPITAADELLNHRETPYLQELFDTMPTLDAAYTIAEIRRREPAWADHVVSQMSTNMQQVVNMFEDSLAHLEGIADIYNINTTIYEDNGELNLLMEGNILAGDLELDLLDIEWPVKINLEVGTGSLKRHNLPETATLLQKFTKVLDGSENPTTRLFPPEVTINGDTVAPQRRYSANYAEMLRQQNDGTQPSGRVGTGGFAVPTVRFDQDGNPDFSDLDFGIEMEGLQTGDRVKVWEEAYDYIGEDGLVYTGTTEAWVGVVIDADGKIGYDDDGVHLVGNFAAVNGAQINTQGSLEWGSLDVTYDGRVTVGPAVHGYCNASFGKNSLAFGATLSAQYGISAGIDTTFSNSAGWNVGGGVGATLGGFGIGGGVDTQYEDGYLSFEIDTTIPVIPGIVAIDLYGSLSFDAQSAAIGFVNGLEFASESIADIAQGDENGGDIIWKIREGFDNSDTDYLGAGNTNVDQGRGPDTAYVLDLYAVNEDNIAVPLSYNIDGGRQVFRDRDTVYLPGFQEEWVKGEEDGQTVYVHRIAQTKVYLDDVERVRYTDAATEFSEMAIEIAEIHRAEAQRLEEKAFLDKLDDGFFNMLSRNGPGQNWVHGMSWGHLMNEVFDEDDDGEYLTERGWSNDREFQGDKDRIKAIFNRFTTRHGAIDYIEHADWGRFIAAIREYKEQLELSVFGPSNEQPASAQNDVYEWIDMETGEIHTAHAV